MKETREPKGRGDWVQIGIVVLGAKGIDGVRVEDLARRLGVTKGSFYWHFRDRRELLDAILIEYERRGTLAIIDRVEAKGGTERDKLAMLFELAVNEGHDAGEQAIRTWAAGDSSAREVLQRVDARRMGFLEGLFRGMGFSEVQAEARARLVYCALVGEWAMDLHRTKPQRLESARLNLEMLTRRMPDED